MEPGRVPTLRRATAGHKQESLYQPLWMELVLFRGKSPNHKRLPLSIGSKESELRYAYVLLPFLSEPDEEEDSEAHKRDQEEKARIQKVLFALLFRRFIELVEEIECWTQGNQSHNPE
jgi:hypothetical protein